MVMGIMATLRVRWQLLAKKGSGNVQVFIVRSLILKVIMMQLVDVYGSRNGSCFRKGWIIDWEEA